MADRLPCLLLAFVMFVPTIPVNAADPVPHNLVNYGASTDTFNHGHRSSYSQVVKPKVVRFKGAIADDSDLEALSSDVGTRCGDGCLVQIYAYSGARDLMARKHWAQRRGDRVRDAMTQAGIDPAHVRVIASSVPSLPLALVSFVNCNIFRSPLQNPDFH